MLELSSFLRTTEIKVEKKWHQDPLTQCGPVKSMTAANRDRKNGGHQAKKEIQMVYRRPLDSGERLARRVVPQECLDDLAAQMYFTKEDSDPHPRFAKGLPGSIAAATISHQALQIDAWGNRSLAGTMELVTAVYKDIQGLLKSAVDEFHDDTEGGVGPSSGPGDLGGDGSPEVA